MNLDACIVDSIIRSRKAVRVFRPDAVLKQDIVAILDVARTAPSNPNTQPWRVHVLGGRVKKQLGDALATAHADDTHPPLRHMPEPLPDLFTSRQEDFGVRYDGALGIDRKDINARSRTRYLPAGLVRALAVRHCKASSDRNGSRSRLRNVYRLCE